MTDQGDISMRRQALTELINFQFPLDVLRDKLRGVPWDSAVDQVELTPAHVRHVLAEAQAGNLSSGDVSAWAELVESREDIGLSEQDSDDLREFVFEAANPEINSFGPQRYEAWIERLSATSP